MLTAAVPFSAVQDRAAVGSSRRTAWVPSGPLEASWGEANPAADGRRDGAMPRLADTVPVRVLAVSR